MAAMFSLMIHTIAMTGLIYLFYMETITKSKISSFFVQPIISCLVIPICMHLYCLTKGFSLWVVLKEFWNRIDISYRECCFCMKMFFCVMAFFIIVSLFIVTFIIWCGDDYSKDIRTYEMIEFICGSMMFISLIIICDKLSVWILSGVKTHTNTNFAMKILLLWESFIIIGIHSNTKFYVATIATCGSEPYQKFVSYVCYAVSWCFVVVMLVVYKVAHANVIGIGSHESISNHLCVNGTPSNGLISNNKINCNNNIENDQSYKQLIKRVVIRVSRQLSTILLIVSATISAMGTISLYFAIQPEINQLKQDYPFVKYHRQLTRSPVELPPRPPTHKAVSHPTAPSPTARPIENVTHVRYIDHPYDSLQTYYSEQTFCWIACLIALSVIVVVLRSKANWHRMF